MVSAPNLSSLYEQVDKLEHQGLVAKALDHFIARLDDGNLKVMSLILPPLCVHFASVVMHYYSG